MDHVAKNAFLERGGGLRPPLDPQIRRALAAAVRGLESGAGQVEQQFAEALARVHGASDLLRFMLQRVAELEAWNREMSEVSARRLEELERQAVAAERQAEAEEAAAARAEEWLRQVHAAVLEKLQAPPAP